MAKRIIHVELDGDIPINCDGLNGALNQFAILSQDSEDLEDILTYAVQSLYRAQPDGNKNYAGENAEIGHLFLCRFNSNKPGVANIEYIPSESYQRKCRYVQRTIGAIDLRKRTYNTVWDKCSKKEINEDCLDMPIALVKDTEKIMKELGLTRKRDKKI